MQLHPQEAEEDRVLTLNQQAVLCMTQGLFEEGLWLASRAVATFLEKSRGSSSQSDRKQGRHKYPLVRPMAVPPAARERSDEEVSPSNPFAIFDYAFAMDYGSSSHSFVDQQEEDGEHGLLMNTRSKGQNQDPLHEDEHGDNDSSRPNPALIEMEISAVLMYNLALAHHKLGLSLDASSLRARQCFERAAYLYHLCGSTRMWFEDEQEEWHLCTFPDYILVRLALIANAGHVVAHLGGSSCADTQLCQHMLEGAVCSPVTKLLPEEEQEFFCSLWAAQRTLPFGQLAPAA